VTHHSSVRRELFRAKSELLRSQQRRAVQQTLNRFFKPDVEGLEEVEVDGQAAVVGARPTWCTRVMFTSVRHLPSASASTTCS